jgi:DNA-binding HxlR family transcriptional regulator
MADQTGGMHGYHEYCPIARATEVLGERWTFIIVRNLLLGCETFTEIEAGAPGIPRSTLTARLRQLERLELVARETAESGRSVRYRMTSAGRDLWDVILALGNWGARWLDVAPEHCDPYNALWSMSRSLVRDLLPDGRVVVRFNFHGLAPELHPLYGKRKLPIWLIIHNRESELCLKPPGFDEDLVVDADAESFVKWHMGLLEWPDALRSGDITITGARPLAKAFPTWNKLSRFASVKPEPARV